jgi:CheY-like chemotaxis protein
VAALDAAGLEPDGLLVDYHLDSSDGLSVIRELRRRFGHADDGDIPAIVITADRSPRIREAARAERAHVLNKPIKPASLRALMTQWRVQRVAAE